MIFRRYLVSKHKVHIWNSIYYLVDSEDLSQDVRVNYVDKIFASFRDLSSRDRDIKYCQKEVVEFYRLSDQLLSFICENFKKDTNFECLKIVYNLLFIDLWKLAYNSFACKVDIAVVNEVKDFFESNKELMSQCLNKIGYRNSLLDHNDDDSSKYIIATNNDAINVILTDLNSGIEAINARRNINTPKADKVLSKFKYSEEINKENNAELAKINKAGDKRYAFVRSKTTEYLIESQTHIKYSDISKDINVVDETKGKLESIVQQYIGFNPPDVIAAYSHIRNAIDAFLKFAKGIDLNASCYYPPKSFSKKQYPSTQQVFEDVFGEEVGKKVSKIWKKASEVLHGADADIVFNDEQKLNEYKAQASEDAVFLSPLTDLSGVDCIEEGLKKLYESKLEFFKEFNEIIKEQFDDLCKRDNGLEKYKAALLEHGVDNSYFDQFN